MTTRVAQLTPKGRGAIASLLVQGPQALAALAACFRPHGSLDPAQLPMGRIVAGRWQMQGNDSPGEELVVCRTGAEQLEVHCHGGYAAAAAIMADLREHGCVEVSWDEIVLQPQLSQVERAARRSLAQATTERTALILLDQYHGALSRELSKIEADMGDGRGASARGRVVQLLRYAPLGLHLTRPWRVVLAGPPNVGKSSLINAMVGFQRAVVYDAPGTTRDVVTVPTAIDGWPIELSDTAGIRPTTDTLESAGVGRARREVQQADLVIWVREATEARVQTLEADEAQYVGASSGQCAASVLRVLNKCDCLEPTVFAMPLDVHQAEMQDTERLLFTSVLTGQGVPQLLSAISQQLVPEPPPPGAAVPFTEEHVAYLRGLLACLPS